MKLKPNTDLVAFLRAVRHCHGEVHFNNDEGDSLNLQSILSQYLFVALVSNSELRQSGEIICNEAADLLQLNSFLE